MSAEKSVAPTFPMRSAQFLIRLFTPLVGPHRAQWLTARFYATLFLLRFHLGSQYARASLGFLWVGLAPLLLFAVYVPVFLVVFQARLPGRDSPLDYAIFALIGLSAWSAFADAIGQSTNSLVQNATIVRHAPTPPIMLPIIKVLASFTWLSVSLAIIVTILTVTGTTGVRLVLLPPTVLLLFAFALGIGLALACFAAYVHDLVQALPTLLSIEFFAAPIAYAPESATGKLALVVAWNPITPFLGLLRASLLPWYPFAWRDLGLATFWATVALVVGIATFRKLEPGLRDAL